jgi:sugar transferase (PEP-CTERM/EpsH1 system associated)
LEKGDKLRLYHQIRYLARFHEVTLLSLAEKPFDQDLLKAMKPYCKEIYVIPHSRWTNMLNAFLRIGQGMPVNIGYFYRGSTRRKIEAIIERVRPEGIFVQLARMAPYIDNKNSIPKYIDYMDAFSLRVTRRTVHSRWPLSWLWLLEARLLRRFERKISLDYVKRFVISRTDQEHLQAIGVHSLDILANGVDTEYFKKENQEDQDYDLVFVGNMSYHPNILAAKYLVEKIAEPLRRSRPDLKVLIAGAEPSKEVLALASSHVTISGYVPDIRSAYRRGKIFLAPIFAGSGLQNKILEAMAMGLPCITSVQVAEAIGAPSQVVLTGKEAKEFVRLAEILLDDANRRKEISEQGRTYVEMNFAWHSCCAPLAKLDQN